MPAPIFWYLGRKYRLGSPIPQFEMALSQYLTATCGQFAWNTVIPERATTYPQVVFTFISGESLYTMLRAAGLARAEYQVDVYADTPDDRAAMAWQIKRNLSGFCGDMNGVPVSSSRFVGNVGTAERDAGGSDRWIYRDEATYRFLYSESILGT